MPKKQANLKLVFDRAFSQGRQSGFGNSQMFMRGCRQAHIKQGSAISAVPQTFKVSYLPVAMGRALSFGTGGRPNSVVRQLFLPFALVNRQI
jgi:hypothetical protein